MNGGHQSYNSESDALIKAVNNRTIKMEGNLEHLTKYLTELRTEVTEQAERIVVLEQFMWTMVGKALGLCFASATSGTLIGAGFAVFVMLKGK